MAESQPVTVTFGFDGLPGDADYSSGKTFLDAWKRATDLGGPLFTTIWASDHLQEKAETRFEAISRVSSLAASFPDHRVGTLVIGQGTATPRSSRRRPPPPSTCPRAGSRSGSAPAGTRRSTSPTATASRRPRREWSSSR